LPGYTKIARNITIFLAFFLTKSLNTGKNLSGIKASVQKRQSVNRPRFFCAVSRKILIDETQDRFGGNFFGFIK